MRVLRWKWRLANRGIVTATIEDDGREVVAQDSRVLSEALRGTKPEGHTVVVTPVQSNLEDSVRPPIEAVVTFDPQAPICILRVDDHEVSPAAWPERERPTIPMPSQPSVPWKLVAIGALVLVLAAFLFSSVHGSRLSSADTKLRGTHRASNGLFIAHFPEDLDARAAVLPTGVGGVVLEDKAKTTTIVLGSLPPDASGAAHDPWMIQQRLRDELLANVPKGTARFEELTRRDETCLGEHGAVVVGQLLESGAQRGRVWSCAFIHKDVGYIALVSLGEPATSDDEKRVRAIVEATELTKLADLGTDTSAR